MGKGITLLGKTITHTRGVPGKNDIFVAYRKNGRRTHEVKFAFPLFDLRDYDLDGKVSWGEWWTGKSPMQYETGNIAALGQAADVLMDVARQMNDMNLHLKGLEVFLKGTYKCAAKALISLSVERF